MAEDSSNAADTSSLDSIEFTQQYLKPRNTSTFEYEDDSSSESSFESEIAPTASNSSLNSCDQPYLIKI